MHFFPLIYIFYFQERNHIILSFAVWSFILSQFFHKLDWDNSVLFFTLELLKNSGRKKKKQTQAWLLDEKTKHNLKNNKSLKTSSQFTSYYIFYGCITMETTYCCGAARIFLSHFTSFKFNFFFLLLLQPFIHSLLWKTSWTRKIIMR